MAALQGVDLEKAVAGAGQVKQNEEVIKSDRGETLLFRDPKDYEKMSPEEREKMTRKMMGKYKKWAAEKTPSELGKTAKAHG